MAGAAKQSSKVQGAKGKSKVAKQAKPARVKNPAPQDGRAPFTPRPSWQNQTHRNNNLTGVIPTESWDTFLAVLAETANVSEAARVADISRVAAYYRKRDDEAFSKAWDEAYEQGYYALEEIAQERAFKGVDKPVFYQGQKVATVKDYSDMLVCFLLKGRLRKVYGDKQEVTVHKGEGRDSSALTDEELDQMILRQLGVEK